MHNLPGNDTIIYRPDPLLIAKTTAGYRDKFQGPYAGRKVCRTMTEDTGKSAQRVSQGEFRHYVFSRAEVRAEVEGLLKRAGYVFKAIRYIGLVEPDFRAKRTVNGSTFEILGFVRDNLDQALDALIRLAAIRAANRDAECVLVMPPVNEYQLIEWLTDNDARWYFGMRDSRIMLWFANPENHSTICFIGSPADDYLKQHFYMMGVMSFDRRAAHLFRNRLLAEEEEE